MNFKNYFKQRLFENIMRMDIAPQIDDSGMLGIQSDDIYSQDLPPDSFATQQTSPTYPTYPVAPPTRNNYPTEQTWQRAWQQWRRAYQQAVQNWNPNPGPPNPAHYPGGENDPRYDYDFRLWHRRFMNS